MSETGAPTFNLYARQRLKRILYDLRDTRSDFNFDRAALEISETLNVEFSRQYFYRIASLRDYIVEFIVSWLEGDLVPEIRTRLTPNAIFDEVGVSARDYFYHISEDDLLDDLDEHILQPYSGVYLCAPAEDKSSYLPLTFLREWYHDYKAMPQIERKGRTLDIKQYIAERSILILQRTPHYYFYAAEYPLSALFTEPVNTGCIRMTYEGIGIISSNSIRVQLRECLSRVPKTHDILISEKTANQLNNPFGLSLYLPPGTEGVRKEWGKLTQADIDHLHKEYQHSIEEDNYLAGPVQISESPIPNVRNKIGMVFSRDYVYHRKPADFLHDTGLHFIRPDLENTDAIQKILDNPLSIGELQ